MKNSIEKELVISGVGVISSVGQGKADFTKALLRRDHAFTVMQRPGRQKGTAFIGAEIEQISYPERFTKKTLRTASFTAQVALSTLNEAWNDAKLGNVEQSRIGLIIGGSNVQQRELTQINENYKDRAHFIPPSYAFTFMDSDICGLCTEHFGIRGFAYTVGGASSGQVAILQAVEAIQAGQADICIALGALMDLDPSYYEIQALRSLGAMGSDRYAEEPSKASRPFDQNRDGFVFGESCGAVVVEKADTALKRCAIPYAKIGGWAIRMDGNRNPNPSYDGEVSVIKKALQGAQLSAGQIDYVNPHGTGSVVGDEIELKAIRDCQLSHVFLNATKSITGHDLTAAGTVEVIATLVQMQESKLHPTRNLDRPIDPSFNWVRNESVPYDIHNAINLSMGFGGINTALCLQRYTANK